MKTASTPRIAFDDLGDHEPALLLMPGWCGPRTAFRSMLEQLSRTRRVIALDWRGHGTSEPGSGDVGYAELLDDALRVLNTAGVTRVIPVATSHAGWTAIDLRRQLGAQRVPGVVFVDWMVLGAPPPFAEALAGLQDEARWAAVRGGLFEMWSTGTTASSVTEYLHEMKRYDRTMWGRAARAIAGRFAAAPVPLALLERLPEPCPTLHVYAQPRDPAVLAAQQAYAADHRWFSVQRLDATSHFPMLEVPGELATCIEQFACRVASQPAASSRTGRAGVAATL